MSHSANRMLVAVLIGLSTAAASASATTVTVFKSAACGCCEKWTEHLRVSGFEVKVRDVPDVSIERKRLGMPDRLASCHIAQLAGGYLVEGHVPAQDIKQLLVLHPKALGIAVPSMPLGAPGMESSTSIPHETLLVQSDGRSSLFVKH